MDAPHASVLAADDLLQECETRRQTRGGPGGQHRNRTATGVFLLHRPTRVLGEATERRSQADNLRAATARLRCNLALAVRTGSVIDGVEPDAWEREARSARVARSLAIRDSHTDYPAVLAMLLNDLHAAGGQPSLVTEVWTASTSQVVRFLSKFPPAIGLVNEWRHHHGRRALK
ncbi:MAG: peptide chain release factor-like protein [Planctomycetota bacterium]